MPDTPTNAFPELDELIGLLDNLTESTPAKWGKMSPQHMVEHLAGVALISAGAIQAKSYTPPEKIPAMKHFLMGNRPMPREFISPAIGKDLLPLRYGSLDEAKSVLKKAIGAFHGKFAGEPDALVTNPAFGDLNYAEWQQFHRKHITHHFTQFGLLPE